MMLYDLIPVYIEDIRKINPDGVKQYLKSHKWKCTHTYPDGVSTLWEKGKTSVRHIPDPKLYSDYIIILSKSLQTIAKKDKISLVDLIKEIDDTVEVRSGYTSVSVLVNEEREG